MASRSVVTSVHRLLYVTSCSAHVGHIRDVTISSLEPNFKDSANSYIPKIGSRKKCKLSTNAFSVNLVFDLVVHVLTLYKFPYSECEFDLLVCKF